MLARASCVAAAAAARRLRPPRPPPSWPPLLLAPQARPLSSQPPASTNDDVEAEPRQSRYAGVYWHKRARRWIADLRINQRRVLSKSFPPEQEKEAALAVDAAIREHLGPEYLTNFDAATGAFLDPRRALTTTAPATDTGTAAAGGSNSSGNRRRRSGRQEEGEEEGTKGVSLVPGLGQFKAVALRKGRPVLLGLFASRGEALRAVASAAPRPAAPGGMAEAPKQSRFLGVHWDGHHRKWQSRLHAGGTRVLSQSFSEALEEEAARVYDAHARKHFGPDALVNFDLDGRFLDPKGRVARVAQSGGGGGEVELVDYRGVSFMREVGKWQAKIHVRGKSYHLGFFALPKDAALAYDAAAREHHKARARCNFDERGNRTAARLKLSNSAHARARYLLREETEAGERKGW